MDNWIEHISEPESLILAWQAPDQFNVRFRWAVARLERSGEGCSLRYLTPSEFPELNQGRTFEELLSLGYAGYPAFNMKRKVHDSDVLATFMRRLPPRNRSDFGTFLRQFRLRDDVGLSNFALLGYTEAKLPSDGFSIVDPLNASSERCERMLEVAGYRYYYKDLKRPLVVGDEVVIRAEPENPHDRNAVCIEANGEKIGNVNRLQADAFQQWIKTRRVTGVIQRLNGKPDHPRVYVFVYVRPDTTRAAA
ncbi:HIRAN domain-containing protein [Sinorhizobium alkalisoli]|uniref:HIRAN domain-containing protein n=1 Tax=Sinorhizobium alkalisoli TaxID=1752398 RepID=UPI00124DD2CB|nr:HIRAN domain-containing protein [Sinorhizobium alkalisoli]